jgi:hypothetical protein
MPASEERFARQHPFGPPPSFRPASPCAGIDRPVSGPMTVTSGPYRTSPLTSKALRACRFPYGCGLKNPYPRHSHGLPGSFSKTNGTTLVAYPRTTASPRIPSGKLEPFQAVPGIPIWFQALFTPLPGSFSAFPHGTCPLSVSGRI